MTEREPHYAQVPPEQLPAIPRRPLHVILDNLRSAFNVGSIFRTSDAAGVAHVHLCGMTAHPPHIKLAKTALGAFDYVQWTYYERTKDAVRAVQKQGVPVVAVEVADGAVAHTAFAFPQPVAVMFGNEVDGISASNLARCDAVVQIPMNGFKNSMNVATAAGIVLYEALRQWDGAADSYAP